MIELLDCLLYKIAGEQLHHDIQYLNDLYRKKKTNERNGKKSQNERNSQKFFCNKLGFPL